MSRGMPTVGGQQDLPGGGHRGLPAVGQVPTLRNRPGEATARQQRHSPTLRRRRYGRLGRAFWDTAAPALRTRIGRSVRGRRCTESPTEESRTCSITVDPAHRGGVGEPLDRRRYGRVGVVWGGGVMCASELTGSRGGGNVETGVAPGGSRGSRRSGGRHFRR